MIKRESRVNIKWVYEKGLCTGCGTCAGLCPAGAIEMVIDWGKGIYKPVIDNEKCTDCGNCHKTCPGHSVDVKELNRSFFGKQPEDSILGNFLECYWGHSTDPDIRYNSSSGGLAVQLLISALEEGIIDGALVTIMKKDKPLEPECIIARTKEEIISASCAKYCPVPVNMMLKEILNTKDGEKFAVIGLPCHMQGIRKAEMLDKRLKEKIALHIGLFCTHGISFLGTDAALKKLNIKREEVKSINYRFGDFPPAKTSIELYTSTQTIGHLKFWNALFFRCKDTIPSRCMLCIDQTCELADISVGSGWFPYKTGKQINQSVCVPRTTTGKTFIQKINSEKKVNMTEVDPNALILFERTERGDKKVKYRYSSSFFKLSGRKRPDYNSEFLESKNRPDPKAWMRALKTYLKR